MASWLRHQRYILERTLPLLYSAHGAGRPIAARSVEGEACPIILQYVRSCANRYHSSTKARVHVMNIDAEKETRLFSTLSLADTAQGHGGDTRPRAPLSNEMGSDSSSPSTSTSSVSPGSLVPILDFETGSPRESSPTTCHLDEDIFHVPVRVDILHRVVRWQLAKRQQGTHKTKTRSEVRGGGRKPWQQKGSGRARQGTIRAVQWRGGGVVHGPVVRSHAHSLQKRVRRLGLKCAVSAKLQEGRLLIVDALEAEDLKTSTMKERVDRLLAKAPRHSALFVDAETISENVRMGIRNLPWIDAIPVHGLNVYSILQRDYLIMSQDAVRAFVDRMRRPIRPSSATP